MKKYFLFFLVLLQLLLLAGCASSGGDHALYADLPTVPQTNEHLSIYASRKSELLSAALNQYRKLYPDVEVELIEPKETSNSVEAQEQDNQVLTQLMAGKGPDILLVDDQGMDIEKLVRQGVFADMEPFFKADGFDWEPYNQAVMDAGLWNGKRFVIPLSYSFDLLCTTREALEETGFNVEACKDFKGFLDETTRYMDDSAQTRRLFGDWFDVGFDFFYYSGISVIDYDEKTSNFSDPLLTSAIHWDRKVENAHPSVPGIDFLIGAAAVRDRQALWTTSGMGVLYDLFFTAGALRTVDETVMMPIRDVNGGIQVHIDSPMVVRGNSENLKSAYDFLKILLSLELQDEVFGSMPVRYSAAENYLNRGFGSHSPEGAHGFSSTTHRGSALDDPSQEEIHQILNLTHEVTGAYYSYPYSSVGLVMGRYILGYEEYEETLEKAQSALELYLTE